MENKRPTVEFTTPATKLKFEVYSYITGREEDYCQLPIMESIRLSKNLKEVESAAISAQKIQESQYRVLEKGLASIEGAPDSGKLLDYVLDALPSGDKNFILEKIDATIGDKKK